MSVEAYVWALNLAPVPMEDKGRGRPPKDGEARPPQPSSACAFVLVALANHADPAGRDAFPAVETLMRYTRLGERTVRAALDRLEAKGVIRPSDPDVIAAKIKRADHRPQGWDLSMHLIRDDLTRAQLEKIGKDSPFLAPHIAAHLARLDAEDSQIADSDEVQSLRQRGAVVSGTSEMTAPEPSSEPNSEPFAGSDDHWATKPPHDQARRARRKPRLLLTKDEHDAEWSLLQDLCRQEGQDDPVSVWWTLRYEHGAIRPSAFMRRLVEFGEWDGFVGSHGISEYLPNGASA